VHRIVALVLLAGSSLFAQSYRGVQVGQRGDLLPPEFSAVKRGEFTAQFGTERMQVYVNGALVTGFRVLPQIPLTLAEAVAKHNKSMTGGMLLLLDPDGNPEGLVDPVRRISYLVPSLSPDAIVSAVGYYNQNTSLLIWMDDADPAFLKTLAAAARSVSLRELDSRPPIGDLNARAKFVVNQAVKPAQTEAQQLTGMLDRLRQICSGTGTSECEEARRTQLKPLMQAAEQFQAALNRAEQVYNANAELLDQIRPPELEKLRQLADQILPQVRTLAQSKP
jgi:hypothetical protein